MGLTGKLCMRPEHVKTVNRELSPAAPDIAWAVEVIAELGSDGSGSKTQ
jgi:citrate lyase subunit beta/citryl-CoA lyase